MTAKWMPGLARLANNLVRATILVSMIFTGLTSLTPVLPAKAAEVVAYVDLSDGLCGGATPCFNNPQSALDAGATYIKISNGTFSAPVFYPSGGVAGPYEANTSILVTGVNVTIEGGYDPNDWSTPAYTSTATVIDGATERCIYGSWYKYDTLYIKNLTLQNCDARFQYGSWDWLKESGGAAMTGFGSLVMDRVVVQDSTSRTQIVFAYGGNTMIENSAFYRNAARYAGVVGTYYRDLVLSNTTFSDNSGGSWGVVSASSGSLTIQGCQFINSGAGSMGAISMGADTGVITNTVFVNSSVTSFYNGTYQNNIWLNSPLDIREGGKTDIAHNTFVGSNIRLVTWAGAQAGVNLTNNIVKDGTLTLVEGSYPTPLSLSGNVISTTSFSLAASSVVSEANKFQDPMLAADQIHLSAGSPAIDAGVVYTGVERVADFEGDPIIGKPDSGADEYSGSLAFIAASDTTVTSILQAGGWMTITGIYTEPVNSFYFQLAYDPARLNVREVSFPAGWTPAVVNTTTTGLIIANGISMGGITSPAPLAFVRWGASGDSTVQIQTARLNGQNVTGLSATVTVVTPTITINTQANYLISSKVISGATFTGYGQTWSAMPTATITLPVEMLPLSLTATAAITTNEPSALDASWILRAGVAMTDTGFVESLCDVSGDKNCNETDALFALRWSAGYTQTALVGRAGTWSTQIVTVTSVTINVVAHLGVWGDVTGSGSGLPAANVAVTEWITYTLLRDLHQNVTAPVTLTTPSLGVQGDMMWGGKQITCTFEFAPGWTAVTRTQILNSGAVVLYFAAARTSPSQNLGTFSCEAPNIIVGQALEASWIEDEMRPVERTLFRIDYVRQLYLPLVYR